MPTAVCRIFGRIMHSQTALHSQLDKGRKNNPLFASPSIRRPTVYDLIYDLIYILFFQVNIVKFVRPMVWDGYFVNLLKIFVYPLRQFLFA